MRRSVVLVSRVPDPKQPGPAVSCKAFGVAQTKA
jgi:hypothetical protein